VTPKTIWLHPRGWVRFAGLDCLQLGPGPAVCVAYSSVYACREQIQGWITESTDVRLLALAFARITGAWSPGITAAADDEPSAGDGVLSTLLVSMAAIEIESRPTLKEVLETIVRLAAITS